MRGMSSRVPRDRTEKCTAVSAAAAAGRCFFDDFARFTLKRPSSESRALFPVGPRERFVVAGGSGGFWDVVVSASGRTFSPAPLHSKVWRRLMTRVSLRRSTGGHSLHFISSSFLTIYEYLFD